MTYTAERLIREKLAQITGLTELVQRGMHQDFDPQYRGLSERELHDLVERVALTVQQRAQVLAAVQDLTFDVESLLNRLIESGAEIAKQPQEVGGVNDERL